MKTRVTFNKRDKVILLFESQLNLPNLETKVKNAHSIIEKYVVIYYQDRQGLNYVLIDDDKILNMRLDFLSHLPDRQFRKYVTLQVETMRSFLARNRPVAVENILKHYFLEKAKWAKTLEVFEEEMKCLKNELGKDGVKQDLILKVLEYVVFEFFKVFQNPGFQISSDKICEATNLSDSVEKDVSSIAGDSLQNLSLFSIANDSGNKGQPTKQSLTLAHPIKEQGKQTELNEPSEIEKGIKKTVVYYDEEELYGEKNAADESGFDFFGILKWFI